MDDLNIQSETTDDDDLPVSIKHQRDTIVIDGKLEQDYRFLTYRFAADDGELEARAYLDDIWEVSITAPIDLPVVPADVLAYLQKRFSVIKQLGGMDGYRVLWQAAPRSK